MGIELFIRDQNEIPHVKLLDLYVSYKMSFIKRKIIFHRYVSLQLNKTRHMIYKEPCSRE